MSDSAKVKTQLSESEMDSPPSKQLKKPLPVSKRGRVAAERVAGSATKTKAKAKAGRFVTHFWCADILLPVAQAGVGTDPGIGTRMAGVCREWREIILASHVPWSHLVVGWRRPREKAILWAQRSRGRITRLTIDTNFPHGEDKGLAVTLLPWVGNVQHLEIRDDRAVKHYMAWEGLMRLKTLRFVGRSVGWLPEDLALLAPGATLETIDYSGEIARRYERPKVETPLFSHYDDSIRLASLKVFRASHGYIRDRLWLPRLTRVSPRLCEVSVGFSTGGILNVHYEPFAAECLTRLEVPKGVGMALILEQMSAPALTHLCCGIRGNNIKLSHIRAPNVSPQNLVALCIPDSIIDQNALLKLLPKLKSLQFLDVSSGVLSYVKDDFLEALVAGEQTLLPNLTALSITCNNRISADVLRRMVLSRVPNAKPQSTKLPPSRKRLAFAPDTRPEANSAVVAAPSTSSRPQVARFKWLNIDRCDNIINDAEVLADLRRNLSFLSSLNRVAYGNCTHGLSGKYAWDAYVGCTPDYLGPPCRMRKRIDGDNDWYLHHTCKKRK